MVADTQTVVYRFTIPFESWVEQSKLSTWLYENLGPFSNSPKIDWNPRYQMRVFGRSCLVSIPNEGDAMFFSLVWG